VSATFYEEESTPAIQPVSNEKSNWGRVLQFSMGGCVQVNPSARRAYSTCCVVNVHSLRSGSSMHAWVRRGG